MCYGGGGGRADILATRVRGPQVFHPPKRAHRRDPPAKASKPSKEELKRHKALEKAVLKAQRHLPQTVAILGPVPQTAAILGPLLQSPQCSLAPSPQPRRELSPDQPATGGPPLPPGSEPFFQTLPDYSSPLQSGETQEALSSPLGYQVGPQPGMATQPPGFHASLEAIIARAIQQGLAQGLQQGFAPPIHQYVAEPQPQPQFLHEDVSEVLHIDSPDHSNHRSVSEEEEESRDLAVSDDEGLIPDQPALIGLFQHQLFRSLLYKALSVTGGGTSSVELHSSALGAELPWLRDPQWIMILLLPCLRNHQWNRRWCLCPSSLPMSSRDNGHFLALVQPPMAWISVFTTQPLPFLISCRSLQWTLLSQL